MGLAVPGQILMSGVARALALRSQNELKTEFPPEWRMHGRYVFKGVAEPIHVFEVGEIGIAPLRAPAYSSKAYREVPWWRRPGLLAVEAALLLAAIAVPSWIFLRSPPVIAFADRDWVVIGNLRNITEEHRFDEAVETAFRLGLEQSHYVNVMSELKVRDTVALMTRDPNRTQVDRAVGSEVAIREGARALILPTVAEVGHRVRVTAEVIDPATQTTVYTESADGVGADSVLGSIDQIDRRLRERLGEALGSISRDSQPLERVATKSLDALRAYSLGQRAYAHSSMKEALGFYQEAVKLDPQFALAHMAIARVLANGNEFAAALEEVELAAALDDRLTPRDALFVDAWRTALTNSSGALDKWKSLTRLYPDFYTANGFYAYYAARANLYDQAIEGARLNASEHNPTPSAGLYLLGILYLATDRYNESAAWFRRSAESGFVRNDFYAMLPAAQRQFDRADALMRRNKPSGRPADDFSTKIVSIALLADQGHWSQMPALLETTRHEAQEAGARVPQQFTGIELSLRSVTEKPDLRALAAYAQAELHAHTTNVLDRNEALFHALFSAYLLARHGDVHGAEQIVSASAATVDSADDPPLRNLFAIAKAEVARAGGHAAQAIDLLEPSVDGNELYLTHLALLDALSESGADALALTQANWLTSHRGRAYAEPGAEQFLSAYSVVQSDIATLRTAELLAAAGKKSEAQAALQTFTQQWPQAEWPAAIAARVATLTKTL
jgi:putative peptide modification system cyclase